MSAYHVVFHLDEGSQDRMATVVSNIENLIADMGGHDADIEVVVNGTGVLNFLKAVDTSQGDVVRLRRLGVRFLICRNSLEAQGIAEDALIDGVDFVPAGVSVLVQRQEAGWAYVKP